jgi:hypothetical protein
MRRMSGTSFAIVCLGLLALPPVAVYADPIRVTGGVVGLFGPLADPAGAVLIGDGLHVAGDGFGGAAGPAGLFPGDVGRVAGSFQFSAPHPFQVLVNNQTYDAFLFGDLSFISAPFVLPPPVGTNVSYQVPFTMTGRVQGFSQFFHGSEAPMFDVDLAGGGTLTARQPFLPGSGSGVPFGGSFQFEAAAATPEPASLLLLGSGVAGLFLRSRKHT